MAKFRTEPCVHYVCEGECDIGREARFRKLCQRCARYEPRASVKHKNVKREKLEKLQKMARFIFGSL